MKKDKVFCCFFWFVGWDCLSLGIHICLSKPNIEFHIPFGFIKIGFHESNKDVSNWKYIKARGLGIGL